MKAISERDVILLADFSAPEKRYLVKISDGKFSTKHGEIDLSALVGENYGTIITSHLGRKYVVLPPTIYDRIMLGVKRQTQIVYPKDSGYIILWLGLKNGMRVFECGAGSGAMTSVLANAVAPDGIVVSYERDERFFELSQYNVASMGFDNVKIFHRDIGDGIDENGFDAAFIDVREPWLYIDEISSALSCGAPIAFVLPTTNQIQMLLKTLMNSEKYFDIRVAETMLRFYKTVPERLRPEDRMVAHTTYILMARKIGME